MTNDDSPVLLMGHCNSCGHDDVWRKFCKRTVACPKCRSVSIGSWSKSNPSHQD